MKARGKGTNEDFKEVQFVMYSDGTTDKSNNVEIKIESNNTPDHWQDVRKRAAIMALSSIIPLQKGQYSICDAYKKYNDCAEEAIRYADALVKELKGE